MNDVLKNFIQQHRAAFDAEAPGAQGWQGVQHALDRLPTADALERSILVDRALLDTETPSAQVWNNLSAWLDEHAKKTVTLECYITENRTAFDTASPSENLWKSIEESLPGKPKTIVVRMPWQRQLLRIAASLTLLLAGIGIGTWYARSTAQGMDMADVSTEYREIEQYYQRDIAAKQQKLATFTGNRPAEINMDLKQLDQMMQELRKDLADVPPANREQVVRAMIENYKAKTAILERVLDKLDTNSQPDKDNSDAGHEIKNL